MKWISVKDGLPEDGVWVLVYGNRDQYYYADPLKSKKIISICSYDYEYNEWQFETATGYEFEYEIDLKTVTHWMPLPEPPNE